MIPTIHFFHGIHDDGVKTMQVLAACMARHQWNTKVHQFPVTNAWNAASRRDTVLLARSVLSSIRPGDHLVGHSHGCGVGLQVIRELSATVAPAMIARVVMLAPALDRRQNFAALKFNRILCIHNPADIAIIVGSLIPFKHPFGLAGAFGFRTNDPRILNEARLSFEGAYNHTVPYFRQPNVEILSDRINDFLLPPGGSLSPEFV